MGKVMLRSRWRLMACSIAVVTLLPVRGQERLIGAEVQMGIGYDTPEKIDAWFKILADYQMPLARIFVPRGEQSLEHCDLLFRAAEKYGVKITATLGGPPTVDNARWIQSVVARYKSSPALDSWILMNEPGTNLPAMDQQATERYRNWLAGKYKSIAALNAAWRARYGTFEQVQHDPSRLMGSWSAAGPFVDWYAFEREQLRWHLNWIADQVRAVDKNHPTHTNPNSPVSNLASHAIDLPSWRPFLDTLGASAHQSWQFGLLRRDQHALGLAYICDLIKGAIEPKPFWITELQAGNTLFSSIRPLYPSKQDIAQVLWTGFGSGAERMIFWSLNSRLEGTEAGEWGLLDFQGEPSERLEVCGDIGRVLKRHADLFTNARSVDTPVVILLSLETMTLQHRFASTQATNFTEGGVTRPIAGRSRDAHLLAALAYYEAFQQLGVPVRIKHIHDFDWSAKSARPRLAILPNVQAMSAEQARGLEAFVRGGNTALVTGLTGAFDPANKFWALEKSPLETVLGGALREIRTLDDPECEVRLRAPEITLPCHLWMGEIRNRTAEPIAQEDGIITATRNKIGSGQVIWIPALVDLAAWVGDNRPLVGLIKDVIAPFVGGIPFRFANQQPQCLMRTLTSGRSYITVITNGGIEKRHLTLVHPRGLRPEVIWGNASDMSSEGDEINLGRRATVVIIWTQAGD